MTELSNRRAHLPAGVRPARASIGAGWRGIAAVAVLLAGCGGTQPSSGPGATGGRAATNGPAATSAGPGGLEDETATLRITGGGLDGEFVLDSSSGNLVPGAPVMAAIWVDAVDNVAAGYGDLITVSLSGAVAAGTRPTSTDLVLTFAISRMDATGADLFNHLFTSKDGECTVTMELGAAVTGSFACASITSDDGVTVQAMGAFRS